MARIQTDSEIDARTNPLAGTFSVPGLAIGMFAMYLSLI